MEKPKEKEAEEKPKEKEPAKEEKDMKDMKEKEVEKEREKIREKDAEKDKEKDKEPWQGGQWSGSQSRAREVHLLFFFPQFVTEVGRLRREMGAPSQNQHKLDLETCLLFGHA